MIEVLVLAVLQGVAEFLPISSSGHLVIAQNFLGIEGSGMRLDLMLHVGTLLSIVAFYRKTIARILVELDGRYVLKIILSAIPAVVVYFCFQDFIDGLFGNVRMTGALLMFTGAVLIGTRYIPQGTREIGYGRAILMGLGQALAILPGVSRSGLTLACARAGKADAEKAAEFSFLMSAPLILGGMILDLARNGLPKADSALGWTELLGGAVVAGVVGYFALVVLVKALKGRWFWVFGPYCVVAGLATLIWAK